MMDVGSVGCCVDEADHAARDNATLWLDVVLDELYNFFSEGRGTRDIAIIDNAQRFVQFHPISNSPP